ncbi:MAG TPA: hypothetical protein VG347_09900 [Verrucomicrobiae bacterium]|nr:hypothetical protein [Verrucomicrobiae bacterium]
MKTKVALLAIAMATIQSVALAQQTPKLSATSKTFDTEKIRVNTPLSVNPLTAKNADTHIDRVGNASSRPWTQIVGWQNGSSSWNPDTHEARFCLVSFGTDSTAGH